MFYFLVSLSKKKETYGYIDIKNLTLKSNINLSNNMEESPDFNHQVLFYVPNINTEAYNGNPIASSLNYLTIIDQNVYKNKVLYKRVVGLYEPDEEIIKDENTFILERKSFILNNQYFLPFSEDLALRTFALARARTFGIVFPFCCLATDAKKFLDVRYDINKRPDVTGKSCIMLLNLFCGLLGNYLGDNRGDGISLCDPVDTFEELNENFSIYKKTLAVFKANKSKNSILPPLPITDQRQNLSKIYDIPGLSIEGNPANQERFQLQFQGKRIDMDRYHIDIERILDENNEIKAYYIKFNIIDPRIDFVKGIKRLIKRNIEVREKRYNYKSVKSSENAIDLSSENLNDDNNMINFREFDLYSNICSFNDLIHVYQTVTGDVTYNPPSSKIEDETIDFSLYDPCMVLNPERIFSINEFAIEPIYIYGKQLDATILNWTSEEFGNYMIHNQITNYFDIQFYDPSPFIETGYYPEEFIQDDFQFSRCVYDDEDPNPFNIILQAIEGKKIQVYTFPEEIYRINPIYVGAIRFLCFLLPGIDHSPYQAYKDFIHPDKNVTYPIQPVNIALKNNDQMHCVEKIISQNDRLCVSTYYSCDLITQKYFGSLPRRDIYHTLKPGNFSSSNIEEVRMVDIFEDVSSSLSETNVYLPSPIRDILNYIKITKAFSNEKITLFPDYYSTAVEFDDNNGFEYYKNLTPISNFIVNFMEMILKKKYDVYQNFNCYIPTLFSALSRSHLQFGFQPAFTLFGDFASGKSKVITVLASLLLARTFIKNESSSLQSLSAQGQKLPAAYFADDASMATSAFFAQECPQNLQGDIRYSKRFEEINKKNNNNLSEATLKTILTEGMNSRERQVIINGVSKNILSTFYVRASYINLTNDPEYTIKDPIWSRQYFVRAQKNPNAIRNLGVIEVAELNNDPQTNTNYILNQKETNILYAKEITLKLQCFFELCLYYIACGAITFGKEEKKLADVFLHRYKIISKKLYPLDIELSARQEEDIYFIFLRSFCILNVWTNICSGVYKDDPYLSSKCEFNVNTFKSIQTKRLLCPTEEIAIMALSYFERLSPPDEVTAFIEFLIYKIEEKGIDIRNECEDLPYRNFKPKLSSIPIDYQPVFGNDIQSPPQYNHVGVVPTYTFPVISTPGMMSNSSSAQNINSDINKSYDANFVDFTWGRIKSPYTSMHVLEEAFVKFCFNFKQIERLAALDTFYKFIYTEIEYERIEFEEVGNNKYKIKNTGEKLSGNPIFVTKSNDSSKFIVSLNYSWLRTIIVENGYFRNKSSYTDQRYYSTPTENALMHMSYEGCSRFDILTPALFLTKPLNKNLTIEDLSSYMKICPFNKKFCDEKVNEDQASFKFPNLIVHGVKGKALKNVETIFDVNTTQDDYGDSFYFNELLVGLKKGYYNNETKEYEKFDNSPQSQARILYLAKSIFESCNASSVRLNFILNMADRGIVSKGNYPDCLIENVSSTSQEQQPIFASFPSSRNNIPITMAELTSSPKKKKRKTHKGQSRNFVGLQNIQKIVNVQSNSLTSFANLISDDENGDDLFASTFSPDPEFEGGDGLF